MQNTAVATYLKPKLNALFAMLRKDKVFARQSWKCCSSCGCAALPDNTTRYAFYHKQDADNMQRTGATYITFGISAGEDADIVELGETIKAFAESVNLDVEWNGTANQRIKVSLAS